MGTKMLGDGESPSASTYFLPQFRQSRRGSIASLASVNQIDKEALSQALDHIHNTASQTDTLTTFNEFAPPPPSSAVDTKGIAGELQGGISGLYNRFRASVGNAIDSSSLGGEDDAADRLSTRSFSRPSPTPSVKGSFTLAGEVDQSPISASDQARTVSGHQPLKTSNRNQEIEPEGHDGRGRSNLDITHDAATGKPMQTAQVKGNNLVSNGAKDDIESKKPGKNSIGAVSLVNVAALKASLNQDESSHRPESPSEMPTILVKDDASSITPSLGHQSSQTSKVSQKPVGGDPASRGGHLDQRSSSRKTEPPVPTTQLNETQKSAKSLTTNHRDSVNALNTPSGAMEKDPGRATSRLAVDSEQAKPEQLDETIKTPPQNGHGTPQHMEDLTARKSLAPPLVSHGESPQSRLLRASSADTNTDSLRNAQHQPQLRQVNDRRMASAQPPSVPHFRPLQRDPRMMNVFSQSRNKVLNKEYWMKDEGARECFNCGEAFSTFRRKHHCRICGQIFDSRCTSILSGERFGHSGPLRVCKPCESIIDGRDDSSDVSDDAGLLVPHFRPRHGSTGGSDRGDGFASPLPSTDLSSHDAHHRSPGPLDFAAPTMSIPATRKTGEKAGRKPTVLEIDASHNLVRPSSSRSLKSAFGNRPHIGGHRRHNSRALQRSFKPLREDEAPFHQDAVATNTKEARLPAFHDDNIIDPDLAPYLSEEESSGDEQVNIMAALNGDCLSKSFESERHGFGGLSSGSRKGRSKFGEKSMSSVAFASRDSDNHSLHSIKVGNAARSAKRRNLSFSGASHLRPSPRNHRATLASLGSGLNLLDLHENISSSSLVQVTPTTTPAGATRMIRSSSMKGDAAPTIELNNASLQHVKKLLHQLLVDSDVSNIASWERALIPILLRATDDVNPDVQGGDDIDIRHYIKLKKIPGGRPGDTSYVSGLVFTKNLALKSMPRSIAHPNIIILTFPLEYTRHQQHFMSLEPVIRQEREFLQNLVNRIAALRPQLLLVERNVSGLAMELLAQADIATAYNLKSSVLEAVSRCCQTRIISSIDKLAVKPAHPGKCASFYLRTYVNKGQKKTYMFLSGCAKELGCTIVLRGEDEATLSKMKRITEFMTYVVYNLKLETCLMRDEYASIPVVLEEGSLSPSKDLASKAKLSDPPNNSRSSTFGTEDSAQSSVASMIKSTSTAESDLGSSQDKTISEDSREKASLSLPREDSVPDDVPMPTFYSDMVEQHQTKILSASPFVKFMQPYLLMRAREQERRLAYLKRLRDQDILEEQKGDEKPKVEKFDLIKPEMVHEIVPNASRKVREVLHAVHDAEYDKALHIYQTQTKQWETYIAGSIHLFDPYAHQNIAVLYSLVCTVTTVPCSGPDLVALGFYNEHETDSDFEADCTLGQYVEDLCLSANTICTSNGCEKKMTEHHRQYVHGEAQLSVFVEQYPCKVQDMEESILMWSVCKVCEKETPAMLMSENTWKYSFGKYLELSFWSSDLRARGELCPHDLHRDHIRYFGYRNVALRVHYDPITLLEIIVPRPRITWKVDNDLRFKNELFAKIEERMNKYMLSVRARIKSINMESVAAEKVEACKEEVDRLSKKAADEHHGLVQKLRKRYMNSKHFEVIPLNRAIRATQEKVVEWDNVFADFDRNFLPSEKDIRRLATLQLKSIFMEHEDPGRTSSIDGTTTPSSQDLLTEKSVNGDALAPQTRDMSQEKADEFLASVVEKHVSGGNPQDESQAASGSAENENLSTQSTQNKTQAVDTQEPNVITPQEVSENLEGELKSTKDSSLAISKPAKSEVTASKASTISDNRSSSDKEDLKQNETKLQIPAPTLDRNHASGIPRPVELTQRMTRPHVPHLADRSQSQIGHVRSAKSSLDSSQENSDLSQSSHNDSDLPPLEKTTTASKIAKPTDKKLSDRLGLSALKAGGAVAHSMIPRSIGGNKGKPSKVSSLARHFEQLSREFERERIKERRQRQATNRQSRAYPMAVSKPIVQVYKNVQDAVEEKDASEEELLSSGLLRQDQDEPEKTDQTVPVNQISETAGENHLADKLDVDPMETLEHVNDESQTATDVDERLAESDEDYTIFDDLEVPGTSDEHHALTEQEAQLNLKLDLPKHEKSSILKMLTNFWAERTASGWQPLDYPLNATDHIFADSDIIVREDEPSSLVAFAMKTEDYQLKLSSFPNRACAFSDKAGEGDLNKPATNADDQNRVEQALLRDTGTHLQYQFSEGSARMLCKVFYAEQFDAVRRKCGVSDRFVESLSRCMKWDSKGGKTKSVFLKTLDDRFVLKSLSPVEVSAFLRFAPAYFRIISESLFHDLPSVIAKMLGFYQVIIKNPVTGIEFNCFLLVMENLFYDRSPTRIFDLKGSMRNRRIQSTGEQNEVLLDENMVEFIYESPLFSREHSKKILRSSVWNDTLFLARQNVMDYSLMIAIDENRKELVVGIIDCIRTYTWDKKLETWIKDRGKNRPTVTSPKEYKSRFREAMSRYVLQAPNCWHQFEGRLQAPMRKLVNVDEPSDEKMVQAENV